MKATCAAAALLAAVYPRAARCIAVGESARRWRCVVTSNGHAAASTSLASEHRRRVERMPVRSAHVGVRADSAARECREI